MDGSFPTHVIRGQLFRDPPSRIGGMIPNIWWSFSTCYTQGHLIKGKRPHFPSNARVALEDAYLAVVSRWVTFYGLV